MHRSPERKWLGLGFGLAALLVGYVSTISYQNATHLIESTNKSKQTYEVIQNLLDIFAAMTVAESGRRGYVFLDDDKEFSRYQTAVQSIDPELQTLRQQFASDPRQTQRLLNLEALLDRRIGLLEQSIALHRANQSTRSLQLQITDESITLRNQIQQVIDQMQTEEERSLQQWLQQSQANIHDRLLIEFLATASSFAILVSVSALLHRQFVKRQQAETMQYTLAKEKELTDLKLRFFSMVSHEFRTPLSIILGSTQLLAESPPTWSKDRKLKNLNRIRSSAKLMIQLLSDILTLTRAEAGKLEFNPESIDLEAFCLNLIEEIQLSSQTANQTGHTIEFSSQGTSAHALLDEKLLYSILSNLLANAIKYSAPENPIQFMLKSEPEATTFVIQDHGIGIDLVDQQQLYEPFYRGQNARDRSGTGLGLAVVKKGVEMHGGEITVQSELNGGTTFTVRIPRIILPQNPP